MDIEILILPMVHQSSQSVRHSDEMDTKINILFEPIQFIQSTIENDGNTFLNMARFCKNINKTNILSSQNKNKVQNGQYNSIPTVDYNTNSATPMRQSNFTSFFLKDFFWKMFSSILIWKWTWLNKAILLPILAIFGRCFPLFKTTKISQSFRFSFYNIGKRLSI